MCRKYVPARNPFLPSLKAAAPKGLPMWALMRQPMSWSSNSSELPAPRPEWKLPSTSRNQPLAVVTLDTDEDILASLQGNQVLLNLVIEATSGISALMT